MKMPNISMWRSLDCNGENLRLEWKQLWIVCSKRWNRRIQLRRMQQVVQSMMLLAHPIIFQTLKFYIKQYQKGKTKQHQVCLMSLLVESKLNVKEGTQNISKNETLINLHNAYMSNWSKRVFFKKNCHSFASWFFYFFYFYKNS